MSAALALLGARAFDSDRGHHFSDISVLPKHGTERPPLPYLSQLERAFRRPLGDVEAYTGMSAALAPLGARALVAGNTVAFAEPQPSPALVTHEATHVIQNQNAGATAPAAAGAIAARDSAAELEAHAVASQVELHGFGASLPNVTAVPAAYIQLNAGPGTAVAPIDKTADAEELRAAILTTDKKKILAVLERNANPADMYALCRAVAPGIAYRIQSILDGNDWARARAYLGDQVALDLQIGTHDKESIFIDLQKVSDTRALDLFSNVPSGPLWIPIPTSSDSRAGAAAPPATEPAPTTLADVQQALRSKLGPDDYYRAMRLLLEKAERALAVRQEQAAAPPGCDTGFQLNISDIVIDTSNLSGGLVPLVIGSGLDPVSEQRVQLAEERIRGADAAGHDIQAFLGLADLNANERKVLAARFNDKPLARNSDLADLAAQTDDATVIHQAILRSQYINWLNGQSAKGINLDVAVLRAGDLVRAARRRLDQLPPDAPEADRKRAQDEVQRLEQMFFADSADSLGIRGTLQTTTGGDPRLYAEQLRNLGADPVTIGRELIKSVNSSDIDGLIATLKMIPAQHRYAAMVAAGRIGDLSLPWPPEKRELLEAYLNQGMTADRSMPALVLPPEMLGPSPDATIALHDILGWLDRGPESAHLVLGRLERLNELDHQKVVSDPRFEAKVAGLPTGDVWEKDFKEALTGAKSGKGGAVLAIQDYPGPAGPWQNVALEQIRIKAEDIGQAQMRRAYIIADKVKRDPPSRERLSPADKLLLEKYESVERLKPLFDSDAQRAAADDIMLGQPQLIDTPEAALDPNNEAEYMYIRLRNAAKIPEGKKLSEWSHDRPAVMEALASFDALYSQARPGGVARGDLAQLAEIYFRAMRAIDEWNVALAENEGLAKLASTVAGVVVAVVVTAATAGAAAPVAVAALAGISAGAASAIAGAAVRWEDTAGSVLTDFGTGFVEGVISVAGAGLAAKIVRGGSAGLAAGEAAVQAGGRAAHAGGNLAVRIAESAIDGAVGGAAGELFQTAVDEATWDRGVASALASMLAAIARGGAIGGLAGGVVGGVVAGLGRLAARSGDDVAQGVGNLLDSSGVARKIADDLAEPAQDELVKAYRLVEAGELHEAEKIIRNIDGIPHNARAMLIEAARARAITRTTGGIEAIELEGASVWPRVVDEKEFRKIAGEERAHAVVIIENGKPQIIARKGASPSAIREEVTHLHQWQTDITMRQRMGRLSEENLGNWEQLKPEQKLSLHLDKLEVEADAQRRMIAQLENEVADNPDAAMRLMDAEETLFLLGRRIEGLKAQKGLPDLERLGIQDPPRLYAKGAISPDQIKGWHADRARARIGESIADPATQKKLQKLGYILHQEGGEGSVFRITRNPKMAGKLPHLTVKPDGTIAEGESVVATFAERRADARLEWTTTSKDLRELKQQLHAGKLDPKAATEARLRIQEAGPRFREALELKIVRQELDVESAGLVAKWGPVIEQLETDSALGASQKFTMDMFLNRLPKGSLTEAQVDEFRRDIRRLTLDYIESLQRPTDRIKALHNMLEIQPDSRSKGELFQAFRTRFMKVEIDVNEQPIYDVDPVPVTRFTGPGLKNPRSPDAVVDVRADVEAHLPRGRYAIEDKSGAEAFKLDQAEDYASRSFAGGFKATPESTKAAYDGLVYVFSRKAEADIALKQLRGSAVTAPVLGKHPGGIHMMYFDASGRLVPLPL
jgi:hypothetical protein